MTVDGPRGGVPGLSNSLPTWITVTTSLGCAAKGVLASKTTPNETKTTFFMLFKLPCRRDAVNLLLVGPVVAPQNIAQYPSIDARLRL